MLAGVLPIGLLSLYSYIVTCNSIRDLVAENNDSAAGIIADFRSP